MYIYKIMSISTPDRLLEVPQLPAVYDAPTRLTSELLHMANVVWREPGIILPGNHLATSRTQTVEHKTRAGVKLAVKQTMLDSPEDDPNLADQEDFDIKIGFIEDSDEMYITLQERELREYDFVGDTFVELIMDYFRDHVDAPNI